MDEKKIREIVEACEAEYRKFRKKVGEIAVENGESPFAVLIAFLEASVEDEKARFEKAQKKAMPEFIKGLAAIVGMDEDELKSGHIASVGLNKAQLRKIIDVLTEDNDESKAKGKHEEKDEDD